MTALDEFLKEAEKFVPDLTDRCAFCWLCGRHLRGRHFVEVVVDGHSRVMHKRCWAEELSKGED